VIWAAYEIMIDCFKKKTKQEKRKDRDGYGKDLMEFVERYICG
jgi:hypothetical protein